MAHYAFLDENNVVTEVIVGIDETELIEGLDPETWYGNFRGQKCVRTSYNGTIRKNFAGVGYTYDEARDAFIPRRPIEIEAAFNIEATFNEETCRWDRVLPTVEPVMVEETIVAEELTTEQEPTDV